MENNTVENKTNVEVNNENRGIRAFLGYIYDAFITVFGKSSGVEVDGNEQEALKEAMEKAGIDGKNLKELLATAESCNNATVGGVSTNKDREYTDKIKINSYEENNKNGNLKGMRQVEDREQESIKIKILE